MNGTLRRVPLIAGNWKMNTTRESAIQLARQIADLSHGSAAEVVICPPFLWLDAVHATVAHSRVGIGAQDCSTEQWGAFTGQVSAAMLQGLCSHVIVGHSERRRDACESDRLVGEKAAAALEAELVPIICIGEDLAVREQGQAVEYVCGQLGRVIDTVGPERFDRCVVAYEPIWAIGTGRAASETDAEEIASALRAFIGERSDTADRIRILYGGSVTPTNARSLLGLPNVDGALVGGASLDATAFAAIVAAA